MAHFAQNFGPALKTTNIKKLEIVSPLSTLNVTTSAGGIHKKKRFNTYKTHVIRVQFFRLESVELQNVFLSLSSGIVETSRYQRYGRRLFADRDKR